MHRKSAYILFLAVLGLLVIGIVMLFQRVRCRTMETFIFRQRQAIWFGIGLVVCLCCADRLSLLATDMVALVCAHCRADALLFSASRDANQWFAAGWDWVSSFSAFRVGKTRAIFSSPRGFGGEKQQ
jgi:cell division protein FtsW (lipid II flippase)